MAARFEPLKALLYMNIGKENYSAVNIPLNT